MGVANHELILCSVIFFLVSISFSCCWLSRDLYTFILQSFTDILKFLPSLTLFPKLFYCILYIFTESVSALIFFKMNNIFLKFYSSSRFFFFFFFWSCFLIFQVISLAQLSDNSWFPVPSQKWGTKILLVTLMDC